MSASERNALRLAKIALEGVEWSDYPEGSEFGFCPSCHVEDYKRTHMEHCEIGQALAAISEVLK